MEYKSVWQPWKRPSGREWNVHGLELFGGSGRDELVGGSGDGGKFDGADRIEGGDGVDVSKGQGGQDTFVYSAGIVHGVEQKILKSMKSF